MNVTPRYLGRGSWLSRRDPRVLILCLVLFLPAVYQTWDARILLGFALVAFLYYRAAGIPRRAVRYNWLYVFIFVGFIVTTNTLITGGRLGGLIEGSLHVYFRLPIFGTPISAESTSYALTQLLRFLCIAALGFPIAYAIAPSDIGVTFARLGIPAKFAYALDLTWRFLPSLAAETQTTIDAQRIRGYEWEKGGRNPFARIGRTVPILVPVTINAIVGAEDTIDAMDLRAFGTGKRTWLRELRFEPTDGVLLAAFAALLAAAIGLNVVGLGGLWVFPFLIPG